MNGDIITLVLADEHQMYRRALAMTLSQSPPINVIGQTGNGPEAEKLFRTLRPDIIVIDITVRAAAGMATTEKIMSIFPQAKIIWLSAFFHPSFSQRMRPAGVRGYLTKSMNYLEIVHGIHKVHQDDSGNPFLPINSSALYH